MAHKQGSPFRECGKTRFWHRKAIGHDDLNFRFMQYSEKDAQPFTIPGGTKGVLYPASPKNDQSIAVIEMDGKYPEKGYSLNDTCTETLYMLDGSFRVEYDGTWYTLNPGDLLMLLPGKKYRSEGKGKACVFITPAWDSKQNHITV